MTSMKCVRGPNSAFKRPSHGSAAWPSFQSGPCRAAAACPLTRGQAPLSEFVVTSQQGAKCVFRSRSYEASGWLESYTLDLEAPDFRASVRVSNPGYGLPPSVLFERLASQWTGWKGTEEWKSMEGELVISATCDRTGHVNLLFTLPVSAQSCYWSASAHVFLEVGLLENLSREAHDFFSAGA